MPRGATCSLISKAITIVGGSTPLSAISPRSRQTGNPHNPVSTVPGEGQRRHAERIAHDAHRPDIPMIFDQAEPHLGGSEKMATAFLRNIYTGEDASWRTKPRFLARRRRFARTRALYLSS